MFFIASIVPTNRCKVAHRSYCSAAPRKGTLRRRLSLVDFVQQGMAPVLALPRAIRHDLGFYAKYSSD